MFRLPQSWGLYRECTDGYAHIQPNYSFQQQHNTKDALDFNVSNNMPDLSRSSMLTLFEVKMFWLYGAGVMFGVARSFWGEQNDVKPCCHFGYLYFQSALPWQFVLWVFILMVWVVLQEKKRGVKTQKKKKSNFGMEIYVVKAHECKTLVLFQSKITQ